jgi:DNA-directed RNA polymerase subunit M/transcription elongation factor TFIIS
MSSIVFSDADDKSYCDSCDALLYERKDSSMICSGCGNVYNPDSINKHHMDLQPEISQYRNDGPELVPMTEYAEPQKKKPTIGDIEDKVFVSRKSGMSITSVEEYFPQ